MDRQTHDDSMYCASMVSHGNNQTVFGDIEGKSIVTLFDIQRSIQPIFSLYLAVWHDKRQLK